MHKIKTLALLTILLVTGSIGASVSAQNSALTEQYTSPDGQLSVSYPQGWFASADGEDAIGILLSNAFSGVDNMNPFDVPPEQVVITVARPADLANSGIILPTSNDPVFMAGHFSGLFSRLMSFFAEGETVSVGDVFQTDVNGLPAATVDLVGGTGMMRIFLLSNGDELLFANAVLQQDQLEQWEAVITSIIESVEINAPVAIDPLVASIAEARNATNDEPIPAEVLAALEASAEEAVSTCNNVALEIEVYATNFNYPYNDDQLLLDNNPNTGWISKGAEGGGWLTLTLNGSQTVSTLLFNGYTNSGVAENSVADFDLLYFDTATDEFEKVMLATADLLPGYQIFEFAPVTVESLDIFLVSNYGGTNYELTDIMVCAE